ncbi:translation initiation factor IF-2-like [Mustela putorius furo]|uniref:Translation initiation factor IF-2-like n=1 Tax=Mustela putorius furo TaxID=9669 RepID=A0A8U0V9I6_MUSPF|nr:translation initiation factor IF-2-like [Mustela putorius furo]
MSTQMTLAHGVLVARVLSHKVETVAGGGDSPMTARATPQGRCRTHTGSRKRPHNADGPERQRVSVAAPTDVCPHSCPHRCPTAAPTGAPAAVPTDVRPAVPAAVPTDVRPAVPTAVPTDVRPAVPTDALTGAPTAVPAAAPTGVPAAVPAVVSGHPEAALTPLRTVPGARAGETRQEPPGPASRCAAGLSPGRATSPPAEAKERGAGSQQTRARWALTGPEGEPRPTCFPPRDPAAQRVSREALAAGAHRRTPESSAPGSDPPARGFPLRAARPAPPTLPEASADPDVRAPTRAPPRRARPQRHGCGGQRRTARASRAAEPRAPASEAEPRPPPRRGPPRSARPSRGGAPGPGLAAAQASARPVPQFPPRVLRPGPASFAGPGCGGTRLPAVRGGLPSARLPPARPVRAQGPPWTDTGAPRHVHGAGKGKTPSSRRPSSRRRGRAGASPRGAQPRGGTWSAPCAGSWAAADPLDGGPGRDGAGPPPAGQAGHGRGGRRPRGDPAAGGQGSLRARVPPLALPGGLERSDLPQTQRNRNRSRRCPGPWPGHGEDAPGRCGAGAAPRVRGRFPMHAPAARGLGAGTGDPTAAPAGEGRPTRLRA